MSSFIKKYKNNDRFLTNEELEEYKKRTLELKDLINGLCVECRINPNQQKFKKMMIYAKELNVIKKELKNYKKVAEKYGK